MWPKVLKLMLVWARASDILFLLLPLLLTDCPLTTHSLPRRQGRTHRQRPSLSFSNLRCTITTSQGSKHHIGMVKYPLTMLQNLSKCEVMAWLCWNLIVVPPLQFYVKSNFGKSNGPKMSFLAILETELWIFGKFETWKLLKMTFLDRLNSPKFDFT